MIKKSVRIFFIFALMLLLAGSVGSCKASRSERKAIHKTERIQQKHNAKLTKEYDKKYKHQTKIQSERQRKIIVNSRKKPKNMKPPKRFFLFRWLGI